MIADLLTFLLALACSVTFLWYQTCNMLRAGDSDGWLLGWVALFVATVGSWMWWVYTAGIGV